MTTTHCEPYPFVAKVIDLFGDRLKQRRELNALMEYAADPVGSSGWRANST